MSLFIVGNIDQAQYCERIKGIIELLGSKLSLDELSKIWRIQVRATNDHARLASLLAGTPAAGVRLYSRGLAVSFPTAVLTPLGVFSRQASHQP